MNRREDSSAAACSGVMRPLSRSFCFSAAMSSSVFLFAWRALFSSFFALLPVSLAPTVMDPPLVVVYSTWVVLYGTFTSEQVQRGIRRIIISPSPALARFVDLVLFNLSTKLLFDSVAAILPFLRSETPFSRLVD